MSDRPDPFRNVEEFFDQLTEFDPTVGGDIAVDVIDESDEFVVVADLPGYDPENIDVQLEEDYKLTVTAEREASRTVEDGDYVRRERQSHSIGRTVTLPSAVDAGSAEASYENGVLTVRLAKETDDEGTDIPVN